MKKVLLPVILLLVWTSIAEAQGETNATHEAKPGCRINIRCYTISNADEPLWIVDGQVFDSFQVRKLDPNNIEEINIVHNGGNYGWMKREGGLSARAKQKSPALRRGFAAFGR